jgi:hypothetical protein
MKRQELKDKYKIEFETCSDLSISEHWLPVIDKLLGVIKQRRSKLKKEPLQILQCKDKFGGLRLYCISTDETEDKWIKVAENRCKRICQLCGTNKNVTQEQIRSWVWTVCPTCAAKRRQEIKNNEI